MDLLERIEAYKKQEQDLQFDSFNGDDAWAIGNILYNRAKAENLAILIDISICGSSLFRYSFDGATGYNDHWISRKQNTVMLQQMSSIRFGAELDRDGKLDSISRYLDPAKHAVCGGGFPITIKNTGVVGCIIVSGLVDTADHQVVVDAITEYLKK